MRALPQYTLRTTTLSPTALAVRDAILNAREPDELIFTALPAACITRVAGPRKAVTAMVGSLETQLESVIRELNSAYAGLLDWCRRELASEFGLSNSDLPTLRSGLKHHADPLAAKLLEPRLRSFVLLAANEDLDDDAWLEAVANNIGGRPAPGWRDDDTDRFSLELRILGGAFRRYQALHFETFAKNTTGGFEPHRVTITTPGGNEYNDVVWVDEATKPKLQLGRVS